MLVNSHIHSNVYNRTLTYKCWSYGNLYEHSAGDNGNSMLRHMDVGIGSVMKGKCLGVLNSDHFGSEILVQCFLPLNKEKRADKFNPQAVPQHNYTALYCGINQGESHATCKITVKIRPSHTR